MLFKVQYQRKKKYIKLNGISYSAILKEAKEKFGIPSDTSMYLTDETGTEVDEEVFSDVIEEKSDILWTIVDAHSVIESPAQSSCTDTLSLSSQSSETEESLTSPKRLRIDDSIEAKELIRTVLETKAGGEKILKEYSKTREITDQVRRKLVNIVVADMVEKYGNAPPMDIRTRYAMGIVGLFPSLKDPFSQKGYVLQDFQMLFGEETSSKLLEKWGTFLKTKIIKEARNLTKTPTLDSLIHAAEENPDEDVPSWDSDMASLLLLVYLLPPPPGGKKRPVKISVREAVDHVVKFHKSCRSLQEVTSSDKGRQPYILAVGTSKSSIHDYYIVVDGQLLPCKAKSSLSAFDELFKTHYVFGISYDQALNNMYTFVQTTIYNIDVGLCHESPRVKDMRSKLLN
ncbi:uncharacterized protein LOC121655533 isoform X2 [Melanotaenia boesemani]|uniref:uncharacterized protein LOC121638356 isoform X2 n=1 Tax=Melanotaenia boesemani TaxID=1250792 RepID=UPI001C04577C|nr:uncharacterized protein LOC121638356 isoform X2 [Melanotaenia boesemani]XP_041843360.1 uncharacterized protein LOC121641339 isoform X2 [Melanotaenia boesemani]XP_041863120.1 uncharacterized protein LOC121653604 isoform X2 [Melanotaenia boesemani]XP_041866200.1 uncharacterized protein LOC121655533 isoform X2 [Melanotaenia boesemani]